MDRAFPADRKVGDAWVVGVQDQRRVLRGGLERRPPESGNRVYFAVAVQLVAKEVGEGEGGRLEGAGGGGQRRFVCFEEAEGLFAAGDGAAQPRGVEQRAGDPAHQVRAFAVVQIVDAALFERPRDDAAGCRFTVGPGDEDSPASELLAEVGHDRGVEALGHQPGQGRPAAAAQQAGGEGCALPGGHCGSGAEGHGGSF